MKPEYQHFELPMDGLSRIEQISSYVTGNLWKDGWTMVGIATASVDGEERCFGVFRQTESEAIISARKEVEKAEKERDEAREERGKMKSALDHANNHIEVLSSEMRELRAPVEEQEEDL